MRLAITLLANENHAVDLTVVVDGTATVEALADDLERIAPLTPAPAGGVAEHTALTLRVRSPEQPRPVVLDQLAPLDRSGLRAGAWVQVIPVTAVTANDILGYSVVGELAELADAPRARTHATRATDTASYRRVKVRHVLTEGENIIGRSRAARVRLPSSSVSRRHAAIIANDGTFIIRDLGSANGVLVNGERVAERVLTSGDTITLGAIELRFSAHPAPMRDGEAVQRLEVPFTRSPRVRTPARPHELRIPLPPRRPENTHLPILAALAPVLLGAVTFMTTQSLYSLIFVALSPLTLLAGYADNAFVGKRQFRKKHAAFLHDLESLGQRADELRDAERSERLAESPGISDVLTAIPSRGALLWSHRPEHPEFLELRFGTGTDDSRVRMALPERGEADDATWEKVTRLVDAHARVDGVPLLENLQHAGSIGFVGDSAIALPALAAAVLQLAALHAPTEVVLCAATDAKASVQLNWLKWLPHTTSPASPIVGAHLARSKRENAQLVTRLEEVLARRQAGTTANVRSHVPTTHRTVSEHETAVTQLPTLPTIVVVVAGEPDVDRSRLIALAEQGADVGIHMLWLTPTIETLPAACRTFVDLTPTHRPHVGYVRAGVTLDLDDVERVDGPTALAAARSIAAVTDSGARVLDETDLPNRVALRDITDIDACESADAVVGAWRHSDSLRASWHPGSPRDPDALGAIVGFGTAGPLTLDLTEQGPHALVGGTTGAGKSEFLQTWIMSLAATYSPDRVTFLLVDYKGGAAFAECNLLPHTVGLVTDLNPHLVSRALTSLRAELHYRERLLAEKGAKDLATLEKASDPDAPPKLLIVIDEFAALATEMPEFVDGVVDIAARGRSLGIHLIMATQRPAGVIRDNLRANTNMRVALRMADESDSKDVIDSSHAARFDAGTPGRAAVRVGPGRIMDFQTAYIGGAVGDDDSTPDILISELPFGPGREVASAHALRRAARRPDTASAEREIERMGRNISSAATRLALDTPRRPWVAELPVVLETTEDLDSIDAHPNELLLGVADIPERQARDPFVFRPASDGNVLFVGASGTGKSSALRRVACEVAAHASADPAQVYGIDCAGGGLSPLTPLRIVGDIIDGTDAERVHRLMRTLASEAQRRARIFAAAQVRDIDEYRAASAETEPLARIYLLVDDLGEFRETYEYARDYDAAAELGRLLAIGRPLGIHVAVSATRPSGASNAFLSSIPVQVVLRLVADSDYTTLGADASALTGAPAGRCVVAGHEVQLYLPTGHLALADERERMTAIDDELATARVTAAAPIGRLPDEVALTDVVGESSAQLALFGIADDTLAPIGFRPESLFVVQGRFQSGTTTALLTLTRAALAADATLAPILITLQHDGHLADALDWALTARTEDEVAELLAALATAAAPDDDRPRDDPAPMTSRDWLTSDDWLSDSPATTSPSRTLVESASTLRLPANPLIVVERAADFGGSGCESALANALAACRRTGALAIVEADPATLPSAWDLYSVLKTARSGLIVKPSEGDGSSLFRVDLPRDDYTRYRPGRGFLVDAGRVTKVQVAR